jgi:hypothetical protein
MTRSSAVTTTALREPVWNGARDFSEPFHDGALGRGDDTQFGEENRLGASTALSESFEAVRGFCAAVGRGGDALFGGENGLENGVGAGETVLGKCGAKGAVFGKCTAE